MSNKPILGGINAILRKQREESSETSSEKTGAHLLLHLPVQKSNTDSKFSEITEEQSIIKEHLEGVSIITKNESPQGQLHISPSETSIPDSAPPKQSRAKNSDNADKLTIPASSETDTSTQYHSQSLKKIQSLKISPNSINQSFSLGEKILKLGLAGNELKLYDYIYQNTLLQNQTTCRVNIKDLQIHLGLTQMSVFRILNRLEAKQAISRKKIEINRLLIGIELSLIP